MDFESIKEIIHQGFSDAEVEVTDLTEMKNHVRVLVVSDEFKGKMLLQQHRMVMDLLKDSLASNYIHAVQLKTMTKEAYTQHQEKKS